ncbi:hypothetical protein SAMD00023353_1300300 [Rosellinia necatrix]|uniref:Uncharacterized protein n=1 Tax=Rosellinia necatrix TaxID=77044 RepID=A0A1S8A6T7_ROSNE|nr:hypothetical protein SAMD00023353_1300300 [Rosellinia necatrix]
MGVIIFAVDRLSGCVMHYKVPEPGLQRTSRGALLSAVDKVRTRGRRCHAWIGSITHELYNGEASAYQQTFNSSRQHIETADIILRITNQQVTICTADMLPAASMSTPSHYSVLMQRHCGRREA